MLLKLFLIFAVASVAADDPWAKVKELKSGAELRVTKKGSSTGGLSIEGKAPFETVYKRK